MTSGNQRSRDAWTNICSWLLIGGSQRFYKIFLNRSILGAEKLLITQSLIVTSKYIDYNIILSNVRYFLYVENKWGDSRNGQTGVNLGFVVLLNWPGQTILDPEWPHRQCVGLAFWRRTFAADSVQQVLWLAARIAVCNTWSSGGTALCRVGGATSQLDLPSLTPLSVAGCGLLQLGAPH